MMKSNFNFKFSLAAGLALLGAPAFAGNDGYFVTYNHEVEQGEAELMVMSDGAKPAEGRMGDAYMAHMLEFEYGVTRRWATEVMVEGFYDPGQGLAKFTGFRWENRYRLRRSKGGLQPVLYMEYEDLDPETRYKMELSGREDGRGEPEGLDGRRERILETRLVLSHDFGRYNVAFNWINETDLRRGAFGFTDFGYALGVRRALGGHTHGGHEPEAAEPGEAAGKARGWKPAAVGLELYGGLGNSRAFGGPFRVQQHYAQPVVVFHPRPGLMLHLGLGVGLTRVSDTLLRTSVSLGF